eukprot:SAG31_NODE_3954_length_3721_cov_2.949475_2_plen_151_part_00
MAENSGAESIRNNKGATKRAQQKLDADEAAKWCVRTGNNAYVACSKTHQHKWPKATRGAVEYRLRKISGKNTSTTVSTKKATGTTKKITKKATTKNTSTAQQVLQKTLDQAIVQLRQEPSLSAKIALVQLIAECTDAINRVKEPKQDSAV